MVFYKRIAGRVPGSIAAGLKGGAQATGRETGGIRFALDKLLAGKFHQHLASGGRSDETVVLFCGNAGHWLKPVGKMRGTFFQGPFFHDICHNVGDFWL